MKNNIKLIIKAKWYDLRGKKYWITQDGEYLFPKGVPIIEDTEAPNTFYVLNPKDIKWKSKL